MYPQQRPYHFSDHRKTPSFSNHVAGVQTVAPILLYRKYSEAWLRVESRYSDRLRTTDNTEMGLVQNAISFQ